MATVWLDNARYADSNGYQFDNTRLMWPWRDWVIRAYKKNMPFDQFVTEQLAGDLLPDATKDQKIPLRIRRPMRSTIGERSKAPPPSLTGGITRRMGRITG